MRIFRAQYKDKSGKTQKSRKWYVDFTDHVQIRHRIPGFENKRRTEDLGRQIEDLVSTKAAGQRPDIEQQRWLEGLPNGLIQKLVSWDLISRERAAVGKLLSQHLEDFKGSLKAKGVTLKRVELVSGRLSRIVDGCKFLSWSDISASKAQKFIHGLKESGQIGGTTYNSYLQHLKQFCNWMVDERRAGENPVAHLKSIKAQAAVREALEPDELRWLLEATVAASTRYCMSGYDRALLYRLAAEAGLRALELRSLTASSFDFTDNTV